MKKLYFFVLAVALFLSIFLFVSTAEAAKFRAGDRFSLEEDEVFHDNLYVSAGTVVISGVVENDLIIGAGMVVIDGDVWGDLTVAGGMVTVDGSVGGDVRAAGGTVTIDGKVGGDLLAGGGDVTLTRSSIVEGDLVVGGSKVRIFGDVYKRAKISAGEMEISGSIKRSVRAETGKVPVLSSTARIGGDFVYISPKKAKIKEGAEIGGKMIHRLSRIPGKKAEEVGVVAIILGLLSYLVWKIVFLIAMFIAGVVLIFLLPEWSNKAASNIPKRLWPSLGLGFLLLILVPIVAIVLCITVIGLPLGLIIGGLYVAFLYISWIIVGRYAGEMLIGLFKKKGEPSPYWSLALGLVTLMIIMLIPIVNIFAYILFVIAGLGASVLAATECHREARTEKAI